MPLRRLAPLTLALALLPAVAFAWTHNPLTNLPVCTATLAQQSPRLAQDGSGGMFLVWRDARGGAGSDDIYAQHVLASGEVDPAWPANGRLVCNATGFQDGPLGVADGAGGLVVAWLDFRSGTSYDIYAHHVLASGALDPAWPANGRAVCTATGDQLGLVMGSDGAGGAVLAWQDLRGGATEDVYAHRVLASGALAPGWPANGYAVCALAQQQSAPALLADGAGGAIIAWQDNRAKVTSDTYDIYAQHVLGTGTPDPAWPTNGRAVCTATNVQTAPLIATDGSGGAVIAWLDNRSFPAIFASAQRVRSTGVVDPAWPANGVSLVSGAATAQVLSGLVPDGAGGAIAVTLAIVSSVYDVVATHVLATGVLDPAWSTSQVTLRKGLTAQVATACASDGAGGAFVAWPDNRGGSSTDLYVHHALASGVADPVYPVNGRAVCTAAGNTNSPSMVSDGTGGALMAWQDLRGLDADVYAQNLTTFGVLGDPEPAIVSVTDLPADQGGRVRIRFNASQMDVVPYYEIVSYGIWRRVTAAAAAQAIARGATLQREGAAAEPGSIRAIRNGALVTWWEAAGVVPARGDAWYTFVAETFRDSSATGNPFTAFRVEARAALQVGWWDSAPDSGYSVDNLAPATPAPFTGQYVAGVTRLHWNPNVERDLAGYRIYRGSTTSFVPGPGNRIASPADTGYTDATGPTGVYKLTAVDVHGNESAVATLTPSGTADVEPADAGGEASFAAPWPNPASASSVLRFTLPCAERVRLAIYDAAGRYVRELANGIHEPGDHTAAWDLRDAGGERVGAGLYFARLDVGEGPKRLRKVVVAR